MPIIERAYEGTIYDMGDVIPGTVNQVYTPHIWYDQSKSYNNGTNIFEDLCISDYIILGDTMDDLWTNEEILNEILQYLNLHIVMVGLDYYIFDWETAKNNGTVVWLDILSGDTMTKSYSTITLIADNYADNDTQLSIDSVYNQIKVTDSIEELEITADINDERTPVIGRQKYMVEWGAGGEGEDSYTTFVLMLMDYLSDYYYADGEQQAYKREWWYSIDENPAWTFALNGTDNYSFIPRDANGKPYDQWNFAEKLYNTPFFSGLISFGNGGFVDNTNNANILNINPKDKYLCINVAGSGTDERSHDSGYWPPSWNWPPNSTDSYRQFPTANDLKSLNLGIVSKKTFEANLTPSDDNVTNYIVFKGDIIMTVAQQTTGTAGFNVSGNSDKYNDTIRSSNKNGGIYPDFLVFKRQNNFAVTNQAVLLPTRWYIYTILGLPVPTTQDLTLYNYLGRTAPYEKNEDGQHYGQQYFVYDQNNKPVENRGKIFVSPPVIDGDLAKRFNYRVGNSSSWFGTTDKIKYVDVLCCQLKVGDKYCVEDHDAEGNKTFRWMTMQEIENEHLYDVLPNGETVYYNVINIGINIDKDEYLIGQTHPIYNNITSDMGLDDTEGMAIPIKSTDNVNGEVELTILGPVNTTWENGFHRHKTWFRSDITDPNEVSILPHVSKIWLKEFTYEFMSDHGKNEKESDKDIVYASDEQDTFVNVHDETEFRFTTTLTKEEADNIGVRVTTNASDVLDSATGTGIVTITNNLDNSENKPEKFYVDAYYNEYNTPKMILETTVHTGTTDVYPAINISQFGKYHIGYLNKDFYLKNYTYNAKKGTTKIYLKET